MPFRCAVALLLAGRGGGSTGNPQAPVDAAGESVDTAGETADAVDALPEANDTIDSPRGIAPLFPNIVALGFPVVLENDMTSLTSQAGGNFVWAAPPDPTTSFFRTIADSPTDTNSVLVYKYKVGVLGGGDGAFGAGPGQLVFAHSTPKKDVGVGYILRFKSPYQSNSSGVNKLVWFGGQAAGLVWDEAYGYIGGSANPNLVPADPARAATFNEADTPTIALDSANDVATDPAYRGPGCARFAYAVDRWYRIESRLRMSSTTSTFDGVFQQWVSSWNGSSWDAPVPTINRTNLRTDADLLQGSVNFEFMFGGGGRIGWNDNSVGPDGPWVLPLTPQTDNVTELKHAYIVATES